MRYLTLLATAMIMIAASAKSDNPKREFRGAWMHTVFQEQYARQNTEQNKRYITDQLDKMQAAGINAVLFQARPCADAFYDSKLEPWSIFLTADQLAPDPYWDPLEFITTEAHRRGMELHAWLNPYRVTGSKSQTLPKNHLYNTEPERFVRYEGDGKLYFDPGLPQNRAFIVDVITDIIDRYNIDAIHFDDYFYPYPAAGKDFPDDKSYNLYGKGMDRGDWRRRNVDKLIEAIHYAIGSSKKPWVRFGISPFGIWRNESSDPRGSKTNGLQNYDELFADVLLWAENGWIDYLIPQLYWDLEHPRASSLVLVDWWGKAVDPKCQLYIGQDVERTMKSPDIAPSTDKNQLAHKIRLSRETPNVLGNCWWPCYSVTANFQGVADTLASGAQSTIALVPAYPGLSSKLPDTPTKVKAANGTISWKGGKVKGQASDPVKYVVYRFDDPETVDLDDAGAIIALTPDSQVQIPGAGVYVVTALDRVNNESLPSETVTVK